MTAFSLRIGATLLLSAIPAIASHPADDAISRADELDRQHRPREALEVLVREDGPETGNVEILRRIAREYLQLMVASGDPVEKKAFAAKSLAAALRATNLAPENAKAHLTLAMIYGRIALLESPRRQVEMSRLIKEETDASLALDPKDGLAWYVLGRWNYEMANLNPFLKGIAQMVFGKFPEASNDRAAECFEKAVTLGPLRPATVIELGRAYAASGKRAEAREQINKGLAMATREQDDAEAKVRGKKALEAL